MSSYRSAILVVLLFLHAAQPATPADIKPATIRIKDQSYWVGQRVPLFLELRAAGSFSGAASFSMPKVPRAVILKIGNPVISSEEVDGESVFVQTHEFALFSQQSGTVKVPAFKVRFSHHEGFTGPVKDQAAQVPASSITIKRPPGSDEDAYLVTTSSLKITESWEPQPGSSHLGAVYQRTITQQAEEVSGMALAPPPGTVPDGIRVYLDTPAVSDDMERGAFQGQRIDKITYAMQSSGTWDLPAIKYVWWDPKQEQFGSKTLPAVTFQVAAPPAAAGDEQPSQESTRWVVGLTVGLIFIALLVWQRGHIIRMSRQVWRSWNPPDRVASRKLLKACRQNDPQTAEAAWLEWQNWQPADFQPVPALREASIELQKVLYGHEDVGIWQGTKFAQAFREQRATNSSSDSSRPADLPELNPH